MIGRYEVVRVLGQGAMGRVLLARDPVLNRDVAIKILRDDLGLPPEVLTGLTVRMRHEAQAAARVSHPNIVTLHDMGEDARVGIYLVFEYVQGQNLKERLKLDRLPPAQVARLARELGAALSLAHLAGVLHRDVKPENVILSATGAKIADFGIARVPDSTLTRTGSLIGTPAYCAPEALAAGSFSPESDQFSFAATLYEAASGERAFPGDDALGVATKVQTDEPRNVARKVNLPDELDDILLRGMNKSPSARYASCAELGEVVAACLERVHPPASRASLSAVAPPPKAAGPQPTTVAIGAVTIAVVSALVGYAASSGLPFFGAPRPIATASATPSVSATASHDASPPKPQPPHPVRPRPPLTRDAGVEDAAAPRPPGSASPAPSSSHLRPENSAPAARKSRTLQDRDLDRRGGFRQKPDSFGANRRFHTLWRA